YGEIIDAGESHAHQAIVIVFPVFIAVGTVPVAGIIVPFVGEADGDAISGEGPELFDEPIIQFLRPFAREERDDFRPAIYKFRAVAPAGIERVALRNFLGVARVPTIFGEADFLSGGFKSKRR